MDAEDIKRRIDDLGPWWYDHEIGDIKIEGIPQRAPLLDAFHGRDILRHVLAVLTDGHDAAELSAIDLGCLEGTTPTFSANMASSASSART